MNGCASGSMKYRTPAWSASPSSARFSIILSLNAPSFMETILQTPPFPTSVDGAGHLSTIPSTTQKYAIIATSPKALTICCTHLSSLKALHANIRISSPHSHMLWPLMPTCPLLPKINSPVETSPLQTLSCSGSTIDQSLGIPAILSLFLYGISV